MTDIIERLRQYNGPWLVPAAAADEIEKLREANEAFGKRQEWWNEKMIALEAERDAAVNLLEAIRKDEQCAHWHEDIDAARGEK